MSKTLAPRHNNFHSMGSSSTHTSLVSNSAIAKAFENETSIGTNSTHTSLRSSGFTYVGVAPQNLSDPIAVIDEWLIKVTTILGDELLNFFDDVFTGFKVITEAQPVRDELITHITVLIDEPIPCVESFSQKKTFDEPIAVSDTTIVSITKLFEETFPCSDAANYAGFVYQDSTDSAIIEVTVNDQAFGCTEIDIQINEDVTASAELVVQQFTPNPTTDITSGDNTFLPTVIAGGVTYSTNPATAPAIDYTVTSDTYFVQWENAQAGVLNSCDITNFSFQLDNTGGTWNIISPFTLTGDTTPNGNLGKLVNIYGFQGSINEFGDVLATSQFGYQTKGIFGPPALHEQLFMLLRGNTYLLGILTSQTPAPNGTYSTVRAVAGAIAAAAGISITYAIPDCPISSLFGQGTTGLDALSTLAGTLGGYLRWDGGNRFTFAYPDEMNTIIGVPGAFGAGNWTIPNERLINSFSESYIRDLSLGIQGTGLQVIYIPNTFGTGSNSVPDPLQSGNQGGAAYTNLTVTKSLLTSSDPPLTFDLPANYDKVYIQILVNPGLAGSGGLFNFVTDNPQEFFLFDASLGVAGDYIYQANIGGAIVDKVKLDYRLFPQNDAVQSGNFTLTLGYTVKDLGAAFDSAAANSAANQAEILARNLNAYKFVKTYQGNVSCSFFGSIPLPGMLLTMTACGKTYKGIIESVAFERPGILNIQFAQYKRLKFYDQASSQIAF